VVRFGRVETTLHDGDVVTSRAYRILGENAGQSVPGCPPQSSLAVFEHAGSELCTFAVENPHVQLVDRGAIAHGQKVHQRSRESRPRTLICREARDFADERMLGEVRRE
jgi:hypothetical protein